MTDNAKIVLISGLALLGLLIPLKLNENREINGISREYSTWLKDYLDWDYIGRRAR